MTGKQTVETKEQLIVGFEQPASEAASVWSQQYRTINLDRPAGDKPLYSKTV